MRKTNFFVFFNLLSHCCPLSLKITVRIILILIEKCSNRPKGAKTNETNNNTTLWIVRFEISLSVSLRTSRDCRITKHCDKMGSFSSLARGQWFFISEFDLSIDGIEWFTLSSLLIRFSI